MAGGWGVGMGRILKTMPNFAKTCFHFERNRCNRRQKIAVELLPTRTSPSSSPPSDSSKTCEKTTQSEQPRTYSFVSRYNIFYRLPCQNHRLQQQQFVIVGLLPDSPSPLDPPTDHTKYRVKETPQEGAGRTGVVFSGGG
jgi:hypothetical protein